MSGESEVIFRPFVSRLSESESVDTGHGEGSPAATILSADERAPSCWRPWPRQIDPEPGAPAELTPLGRKLLGIDRW
jgi:hypothetical protein